MSISGSYESSLKLIAILGDFLKKKKEIQKITVYFI